MSNVDFYDSMINKNSVWILNHENQTNQENQSADWCGISENKHIKMSKR